ncbi:MAG: TadE/TadG family type IV pilus assembly protein [Nocardioides sp.]
MLATRRRSEAGAAVVDVVLVIVVLVPLVLGILQVALVLHVRNTLASAAAEGARYAAAQGRSPQDGESRTRAQVEDAISGRFADDITVRRVMLGGAPTIEVVIAAEVPPLGLGGPGIDLEVVGHATQELP